MKSYHKDGVHYIELTALELEILLSLQIRPPVICPSGHDMKHPDEPLNLDCKLRGGKT